MTYLKFRRWIKDDYKYDFIIHFGMQFDKAYFDKEFAERGLTESDSEIKDYNPIRITDPDPINYPIVSISSKGMTKYQPSFMLDYLRDCKIMYDSAGVCRKFDGRVYSVFSQDQLEGMIYRAVDVQAGRYVTTPHDVDVTVSAAKHLLLPISSLLTMFEGMEKYETENTPLLAFENGIYNPETEEFLPFTPFIFLTTYIHARFDPAVRDAPARTVLMNILPQQQTLDFLYEMMGYLFFEPTMFPPALFNLYGPGNTGKSAISNMITEIMGWENVSELGIEQLTDKFTTAELEGKRLNICGETDDTSSRQTKVMGSVVKKLSDGQRIWVQHKHGRPFRIVNTAKLLFCTNSIPDFGDDSSGMYRRLYVIPCREQQDPKAMIYEKLTTPESKSWVVNRSLFAYKLFVKNGKQFSISPQMAEERKQFESQNSIMDFIQQVIGYTDPEDVARAITEHEEYSYTVELYGAYLEYARATLSQPISRKKFVEKIRNEYNLKTKTVAYRLPTGTMSTRTQYIR